MAKLADDLNKKRLRSSNITVSISIALVLFLVGLFGLILINAQRYSDYIKEQLVVEAYFDEQLDPKDSAKADPTKKSSKQGKQGKGADSDDDESFEEVSLDEEPDDFGAEEEEDLLGDVDLEADESASLPEDDFLAAEEFGADLGGEEEELDASARSNDPVRVYLRKMGQVALLSRDGEVEIAKKIENEENKLLEHLVSLRIGINHMCDVGQKFIDGVLQVPDECIDTRKYKDGTVEKTLNVPQHVFDIECEIMFYLADNYLKWSGLKQLIFKQKSQIIKYKNY